MTALVALYARECGRRKEWLRGLDLNQRPPGYEPDELPGCSTPRTNDTTELSRSARYAKCCEFRRLTPPFHSRRPPPLNPQFPPRQTVIAFCIPAGYIREDSSHGSPFHDRRRGRISNHRSHHERAAFARQPACRRHLRQSR